MTNQGSCVVLWNACPFTLGDEPFPCSVEHSASEVWVADAEFGIGLHHLVHSERRKQPALLWQGCIQRCSSLLCSGTSRSAALDFSCLISLGWIWMNRPKFPLLMTSLASSPQISPERIPVSSAKKKGAREHPVFSLEQYHHLFIREDLVRVYLWLFSDGQVFPRVDLLSSPCSTTSQRPAACASRSVSWVWGAKFCPGSTSAESLASWVSDAALSFCRTSTFGDSC